MATYFGEVLETPSRAFDGDCEEISSLNDPFCIFSKYELSWVAEEGLTKSDLFILVDGKCAKGFSSFLRSKAASVAKITELMEKDDSDESPVWKKPQLPSFIYKLCDGVYLCEVSPDVKVVNANYFSAELHEFLKNTKEVVILHSKTSSDYVSPARSSPPFLKGLSNTSFLQSGRKLLAPVMDSSNLITGVPASVLTWCAAMKVIGSLYVCYSPKEDIDSVTCALLKRLLSQFTVLSDFVKSIHVEVEERTISQKTGNLYL